MNDNDDEARLRRIAENIQRALGKSAVVIVPPSQPAGAKVLAFKPKPKTEKSDD